MAEPLSADKLARIRAWAEQRIDDGAFQLSCWLIWLLDEHAQAKTALRLAEREAAHCEQPRLDLASELSHARLDLEAMRVERDEARADAVQLWRAGWPADNEPPAREYYDEHAARIARLREYAAELARKGGGAT